MWPCLPVPLLAGVHLCTGAIQGCHVEGRGSGWCMQDGEVFHPLRHPLVKAKGSLYILRDAFQSSAFGLACTAQKTLRFRQATPSLFMLPPLLTLPGPASTFSFSQQKEMFLAFLWIYIFKHSFSLRSQEMLGELFALCKE